MDVPTPEVRTAPLGNNIPTIVTATQEAPPVNINVSPNDIDLSTVNQFLEEPHNMTTVPNNRDYGILLHHEQENHFVLSQYCLPINTSLTNDSSLCKFGERSCVVHKAKLLTQGSNIPQLSSTAFSASTENYGKYKYSIMDTRLVKCFNPNCIDTKTNRDKMFHHVCFMHSFTFKTNKGTELITLDKCQDNITGLIKSDEDTETLVKSILESNKNLIFPVCSKRCFKYVSSYKTKKDITSSNSATWEGDGSENVKSSSEVLINWLTTEENSVNYFGGSDKDGRTSSTRKETYHNQLVDLIRQENGSIRSPESVRTKINRIMESFKIASERMANTGAGLEGFEHEKFQDYIVEKVCRYYFDLLPILQDRPNVTPWFTNYDDDSSDESNTNKGSHDKVTYDCNSSCGSDSDLERTEIRVVKVNKVNAIEKSTSDRHLSAREYSSSSSATVLNRSVTDTDTSKEVASDERKTSFRNKGRDDSKLSPIMAKQFKKNMFRDKSKQINAKKKRNKNNLDDLSDEEEHEYMVEQRKIKMKFELEKYNQSKVEHSEKMEIEKKRLEMETEEMKLRIADTKNKLVLNRVEIFKARLAFKQQDPNISEEFLDIHFPLV